MKEKIFTKSLALTDFNIGDSFALNQSGRTSFQPMGTVTGLIKIQFSNDNKTFFDLVEGLDVSKSFIIPTTDYFFYRFSVTKIGTGIVRWAISSGDVVGASANEFTNYYKTKLDSIEETIFINSYINALIL